MEKKSAISSEFSRQSIYLPLFSYTVSATLLETGSSDYRILLPIRSCLRGIGAGLSFDSSDQIQIQRAGWVSYLLSGVCDLIRPQSPPEELFA